MKEIAETLGVGRSTLYRQLGSYKDGGDCALIIYRNTRTRKIDKDTNRRYGETRAGEKAQLEADKKWFSVAPTRWPRLKAVIYVADGIIERIRAVNPDLATWGTDDRGYADIPVTAPLTPIEVANKFPTLDLTLGTPRPHQRGKLREYLNL